MKEENVYLRELEAAKSAILEWMISQLLSDDPQLQEETLDSIRTCLADERDGEVKEEMDKVFLAALQSGCFYEPIGRSPFEEERWPEIARTLGLNPDMNAYRSVSKPTVDGRDKKGGSLDTKPLRRPLVRRWMVRAAAVLLPAVMVAGGYLWWNSTRNGFVATTSVTTQADSVRHITLPDGTEVTLNRNSSFSYNEHREGELTGEAYFNVTKDPEHPFVIHSDKLTVTVLGTEFNFTTLDTESRSTVALYSGAVRIETGEQEYTIAPGEEFTFDRVTDLADIHDFDMDVMPGWMEAPEPLTAIIPLGEIFELVETEYGVTITDNSNVDVSRIYNFSHDDEASIEHVMQALQFAGAEFDYTIEGENLIITNKRP